MTQPSRSFFDLCDTIGKKIPWWTQGAGGNISEKVGNTLWIKASGFRLDAVAEKAAFVSLAREQILQKLRGWHDAHTFPEEDYMRSLKDARLDPKSPLSPSMETGFHCILPRRWVCHFHALPSLLMGLEYKKDPERFRGWLAKNFPELSWAFVPAQMPGLRLSLHLFDSSDKDFYLLDNHGVIWQSDTPGEFLAIWSAIEERFLIDFAYATLLAFAKSSVDAVVARLGALTRALPFYFYMPDAAVFADRIGQIWTADKPRHGILRADAFTIHRDAAELFIAMALLHHACPTLPELPAEITGKVAQLPTEQIRRNEPTP